VQLVVRGVDPMAVEQAAKAIERIVREASGHSS